MVFSVGKLNMEQGSWFINKYVARSGSSLNMSAISSGEKDQNLNETSGERSSKKTFCHHEVPTSFHEPFIITGYRNAGKITVTECIMSLFSLHNETFNIWSHLIATLYFIVYFCKLLNGLEDLSDPYVFPLICFAFGICVICLASALAHLFNCISWRARHVCFYIDYASISIFTFTSGQVNYFYSRPARDMFIYRSPAIYLAINFILSFMLFINCSVSRHRFRKYRFLLRTGFAALTWVYDVTPSFLRMFTCEGAQDCNVIAYNPFYWHLFCYMLSAICNVSRFPERFLPGYFDIIGYSHHFLHLLGVVGNAIAFRTIWLDMIGRREALAALPGPSLVTTFGFLGLLIFVNMAFLVYFASQLHEDKEAAVFGETPTKKKEN